MSTLSSIFDAVTPLSYGFDKDIRLKIDNKTKPPGALGQLETLARQMANVQCELKGEFVELEVISPTIMVFAADHGVAVHGVSIAPQAVTEQMVHNFLAGGAAINCFCFANDVRLKVVDCGVIEPITSDNDNFVVSRMGAGTKDFSVEPAMSRGQVEAAISQGAALAFAELSQGTNVMGFGEMGIGNTSSASAILAALTDMPVNEAVGLGTGINHDQLFVKQQLVQQALSRIEGATESPLVVLQQLGGFEIAHMVGAMLACASEKKLILVDGFISSVAALVAFKLKPQVRDYMVFCHASAEKAHEKVMQILEAQPLLKLEMRLGEGTGCALAIPLLRAAAAFYNDMATFESAQVLL